MINQNDLKEYKNIKAPNELKNNVLNAVNKKQRRKPLSINKITSIAACFLVLLVGIYMFMNPTTAVEVIPEGNGNIAVISQALSREINPSFVTVRICGEGRIKIKAVDGDFYLLDEKTFDFIPLKKSKIVKDQIVIGWDTNQKHAEISINGTLYEFSSANSNGSVEVFKIKK